MKLFGSLITLLLPSITLAGLYYPPILSPKAGDLIAIGSNFTVIWNTTIPAGIKKEDIAKSTEVRMGIYFPPQSPNGAPAAYLQWVLYELNPPPNPHPGWAQKLDFYKNKRPNYLDGGVGWAQFQLNEYFCDPSGELAIAWADSPYTMSGPFKAVGDCWTGP